MSSKANLLIPSCGEGKCDVYCRVPSKEYRWLMLKRPKLLNSFQGKVFKGRVRESVVWYVISSWTFF